MNPIRRIREWLLELEIRRIRDEMASALDRKEYKRAYVLLDRLRDAIARRSPAAVRRIELARGLR